jgi:prepilin peptidase CpaA
MLPIAGLEISAALTGVLCVVVALAIREDLLRHRIPNALNATALALGLGLAFLGAGTDGLVHAAGGVVVGFAALAPLYLLGGMGAGDVKLMSAAGAYLGPSAALLAAASALVAGAVLAVGIGAWRVAQTRRMVQTYPSTGTSAAWQVAASIAIVRKERFPYAIAIAVGVITVLWLRGALANLAAVAGVQ